MFCLHLGLDSGSGSVFGGLKGLEFELHLGWDLDLASVFGGLRGLEKLFG